MEGERTIEASGHSWFWRPSEETPDLQPTNLEQLQLQYPGKHRQALDKKRPGAGTGEGDVAAAEAKAADTGEASATQFAADTREAGQQ